MRFLLLIPIFCLFYKVHGNPFADMMYNMANCEAEEDEHKADTCWFGLSMSDMPLYDVKNIEMPLDHFNLFDKRTWKMRYLVNNHYYKPGGPLFVYVGGESESSGSMFFSGPISKLARQYHGMVVETEHRYYGRSLPFRHFTTENLQYLQFEQALEDMAYFIETYKQQNPSLQNATVVLYGCSYPGMLATWMRLKYPHIVDLAYASSAPLGLWVEYPEYFDIVYDVYANVSSACIESIKLGFKQLTEMQETAKGRGKIRRALRKKGCENLMSSNVAESFAFKFITMHDSYHFEQVGCVALTMDIEDTPPYKRIINYVATKSASSCRGTSDGDESDDDEEENEPVIGSSNIFDEDRDSVSWAYQTCTEMGTFFFLNSSSPKNPFNVDLTPDFWWDRCAGFWEGDVERAEKILREGVDRKTRRYGGTKPAVTKVLTVQGTHDPWRDLAYLGNYTDEAPVFIIDGAHCSDAYSPVLNELIDEDPESLKQLRKTVNSILSKWIDEAEARKNK